MDRLIVNASVAIAWVHPGQATAETNALLGWVEQGTSLVIPALWSVEVANALLVLERRGKLTAEERTTAVSALLALNCEIDHEMASLALTRLSQLAEETKLSAYDAAYLELALRLNLPLACKDGPLRDTAKKRRVAVVP
jgi:predicted nucleic acid-binding protein